MSRLAGFVLVALCSAFVGFVAGAWLVVVLMGTQATAGAVPQ